MIMDVILKKFIASSPFIWIFLLLSTQAYSATFFVDKDATGLNNGTSWTNAWTSLASVPGVNGGDIVYISGGSTSKTYKIMNWTPPGGSAGSGRVTYQTGQDAGHNGTVIFDGGGGGGEFILNPNYITISGEVSGVTKMTVQNYLGPVVYANAVVSNNTFKYIYFPSMIRGFYIPKANSAWELDHLEFHKIPENPIGSMGDDIIYGISGTGYDNSLIHDSSFYYPVNSTDSAWGDDVFKWISGTSVYNCYFKADTTTGYPQSGQHADVFQISGNYVKIYNNVFEDVGESIVFHDRFDVPANNVGILIYNNVLFWTNQGHSGVARAFEFQPESAAAGTTFTDFVVANNTFFDWPRGWIRINNMANCIRCLVANNIMSGVTFYSIDSRVTISNNTSMVPQFVRSIKYAGTSNDLHLLSSDTVAKDRGVPVSIYFTTDKDGVSRPEGSAWDIGAYELLQKIPKPPHSVMVK